MLTAVNDLLSQGALDGASDAAKTYARVLAVIAPCPLFTGEAFG